MNTTEQRIAGVFRLVASAGRARVRRRWPLIGLVGVRIALGGLGWRAGARP